MRRLRDLGLTPAEQDAVLAAVRTARALLAARLRRAAVWLDGWDPDDAVRQFIVATHELQRANAEPKPEPVPSGELLTLLENLAGEPAPQPRCPCGLPVLPGVEFCVGHYATLNRDYSSIPN